MVDSKFVDVMFTFWMMHPHDVLAVGRVICPELAVPPLPTVTKNVAVPLAYDIDGEVPNPLAIVGAVALARSFPLSE